MLWPWQLALSSFTRFQGGVKREAPLGTSYLEDLPKLSFFSLFSSHFYCLDRSLKCNDVLLVSLPLSGSIEGSVDQ